MPLQATSGAASYDAFGGGVPVVPNYIEEVFSTYLYTGNDSTQTITNNIDLSTKGGMVFVKGRDIATGGAMIDTVRGVNKNIVTDQNYAQDSDPSVSAFNITGFSINSAYSFINDTGNTYVSWTFRKQPKFFDVVTYTGNGSGNRIITSSLGSPIGCVFIKRTDSTSNWATAHRKDGSAVVTGFQLNTTAAATYPNSSNDTFDATGGFNAGYIADSSGDGVNVNGATYVAYLFAHDAGGFGLTGTDNVISCGSYTGNGSADGPSINLGYEAQYVLIKRTDNTASWYCQDNMRGMSQTQTSLLVPNTSAAESAGSLYVSATATGFKINSSFSGFNSSSATYIYIAIRRGPMKVPTDATKVFSPVSRSGTNTVTTITAGFAPDFNIAQLSNLTYGASWWDKLRGPLLQLGSFTSGAEDSAAGSVLSYNNTAVSVGVDVNEWINGNSSSNIYANWIFQRAPSFSDVVCYSGNGSARTLSHNLAAVPELIIVKRRNAVGAWDSYSSALANTEYLVLNTTSAKATSGTRWNSTTPTSSVFSVGTSDTVNASGGTYVAYLFATCAGVSKVGTYTGNGSTQTIDCGFGAGGVRFVLIKRTDSTGDWYVYDTARGMTTLTDPYLRINVQAAQTATLGSVTTVSTGFALNSTILAAINVNGGTYIFLAIA